MNAFDATFATIHPVDRGEIDKAYARLDSLTKPRRSLGRLEDLAARYAAIRRNNRQESMRRKVVVFAGDHGVVAEGVSAYPQEVTGLMVRNFLAGGAAINVLARQAQATVAVVDVGMKDDLGELPGLIRGNVRRGTANMATEPAMTRDECVRAIELGLALAHQAAEEGVTLLATGEMGIGNTTPATALFAHWLSLPVSELVGPGTGLDREGVEKKAKVISRALKLHRVDMPDPVGVLAAVGGLEIAAIAGICLGAAARGLPVVVDGFISGAGALAALRLCPTVKDYLFFSHLSAEPGHACFMKQEGIEPVLDLGLRLGEGTGAALAMQVLGSAWAIYCEMATFAEVGITPGA